MRGITIKWQVEKNQHNWLLRDFLRKEKQISRLALTDIKKYGKLMVNGIEVTVRAVVSFGDEVTVVFPAEKRSEGLQARNIPLSVVYEDDHLLVINKQAFLVTIPSIYHPERSLANAVLYYYDRNEIPFTFHAVNRLDRDTSGLLIVAKHRYAHDLLTKQQRLGQVKRTYLAIVHGLIENEVGTISAPLGRKEESMIEREVKVDGQEAVTHYKVVKYLEHETVVQLQLETGRTHQIRVHLASIGHPLLGDDLYGGLITKINRQALHSWQLDFFHPILKQNMSFNVAPPEDINKLTRKNHVVSDTM
jgi:23S rRNA pseudouridine1911/1915/1917 synthase